MTTRARSRVRAIALAGVLALVPVAGSVALAPAASADDLVVPCLSEEQAADPDFACIEYRDDEGTLVVPLDPGTGDVDRSELTRQGAEPISADVEIEPISAELGAEDGTVPAEEEVDYLGSLLVLAGTSLLSFGSIAVVAYFLFFKKPPVRKNAV